MQIGEKTYSKGLGHHANGSIEVPLEGQYASFDAEVGLQPCGAGGSVIFRVLVDDQVRFDSGIVWATNAPKPVQGHVTAPELPGIGAGIRPEIFRNGDAIVETVAKA